MHLSADALMTLHVEALFTHDARGDLLRVNEPNGAPAPRFFVGVTSHGPVLRFRGDVSDDIRRELELAVSREIHSDVPSDPETYASILSRVVPVERTWAGPAFSFPDIVGGGDETVLITAQNAICLRPLFEAWLPDVVVGQPLVAMVVDQQAVAVCAAVRTTLHACEAGVETAFSMRGRGHAANVVAGWCRAVRERGLVPLYSTSWQNETSRSLARKLNLVQFGTDLHLT